MISAPELNDQLRNLIKLAIEEDTGSGDITTLATVPYRQQGRARLVAKSEGIIAGQKIFNEVFKLIDSAAECSWFVKEGDLVGAGTLCAELKGNLHAILTGERTALNFIQRMSGVASLTFRFMQKIKHTRAKIIDTRKTTPLWRMLEKYAVTVGGGANHRMGLYDMFLIKDNHIAAAGGIGPAVRKVLEYNKTSSVPLAIEVETKNLSEVREALEYPVHRIMLDNMPVAEMKETVKVIDRRCETEASGGVTLDTVVEIAETGVDFISVGALTHSAPALDLSLLVESN